METTADAAKQSGAEDSDEEEPTDDEAEEPSRPAKGVPPAGNKRKGPPAGGPKRSKWLWVTSRCKCCVTDHSTCSTEAPRVNVEYEVETEPLSKEMLANW